VENEQARNPREAMTPFTCHIRPLLPSINAVPKHPMAAYTMKSEWLWGKEGITKTHPLGGGAYGYIFSAWSNAGRPYFDKPCTFYLTIFKPNAAQNDRDNPMKKWLIDTIRKPRTPAERNSGQKHIPIIARDESDFLLPMPVEFVKCAKGSEEMIMRVVEGWPKKDK